MYTSATVRALDRNFLQSKVQAPQDSRFARYAIGHRFYNTQVDGRTVKHTFHYVVVERRTGLVVAKSRSITFLYAEYKRLPL